MKISWNWLHDYLKLEMEPTELAERLAMAGLNHEGTIPVGDDLQIDLEVTSNRADCLGHIGVAREIGALWSEPLSLPALTLPAASDPPGSDSDHPEPTVEITIDCPDLCPRYIARRLRGVQIGPSPKWLVERLQTLGIAVINNVVDVTNYVMMECGQPLHAFDFTQLRGGRIVIRRALPKESFVAIDHRTYELDGQTCVIADSERAVAIGGVMGGEDSEVSSGTVDILVEAADFHPVSIRNTARRLQLHSPSSHRFERRVDPQGLDWASRRACDLILQLGGGQLYGPVVDCCPDLKAAVPQRPAILLRWHQLPRILGIDLPRERVVDILERLGVRRVNESGKGASFVPPSWRRDLTREIDLIEEVARIHGYDQIPEDVGVPMVASQRTDQDRVLAKVRQIMTAAGFDEALTASMVDERTSELLSPWTTQPPLRARTAMLRGADALRRSLIPSLLAARQNNQARSNPWVELFEIARIYLPRAGDLPSEPVMLGLTSGRDFRTVKGVLEAVSRGLGIRRVLDVEPLEDPFFEVGQAVRLVLAGHQVGVLVPVAPNALKQAGLRSWTMVAEIQLDTLAELADLVPQARPVSGFPPVDFDLNFVVDEQLAWRDLEAAVRRASGPELESVEYRETYRDPQRDGRGKKRLLLAVTLRADDRTLTGEEAEAVRKGIVQECQSSCGAALLS